MRFLKFLSWLVIDSLLFNGTEVIFCQTNFWQSMNGPYYESAYYAAISSFAINSNGYIFTGTHGNGVFRSTNNGDSWMPVNAGLMNRYITSLAISPATQNIFVETGSGGIFRSANSGNNWDGVNSGLPIGAIWKVLAINLNGDIFAGAENDFGIYRSIDNGASWVPVNIGLTSSSVTSLTINANGHIFAGTSVGGIFRSMNNGSDWVQVNTGLTDIGVSALIINSSGHIFAGTSTGIFRSTDGGESWALVNADFHASSFVVNAGGDIFAGTFGRGVFLSEDDGMDWRPINTGLTDIEIYTLTIDSSGNVFAGTSNGGGIFRLVRIDGTWTTVNNGLTPSFVTALVIDTNGDIFAGTGQGKIFHSSQRNGNWILIADSSLLSVDYLAINSKRDIFAAGNPSEFVGYVFRSTNNGSNWKRVLITRKPITAFVIGPNGDIFVAYNRRADGGMLRSTDNGETWTTLNNSALFCTSLAINSVGHVFAGYESYGMRRSTDNGNSWTVIMTNTTVTHIAINANGYIFVKTSNGVFRSTDNGENWIKVSAGLENVSVGRFAFNPHGHIFAGTQSGVFQSVDNGENWTPVSNDGLTDTIISVLAIDSSGYLFVGTRSAGVFRSMWSTTSIKGTTKDVPTLLSLEQNYPNPFNPNTTIQFTLFRSGYMTLKVYNTLGEEVATLVAGNLSAGKHQVAWNVSGMADGVYLYRLKTGEFVQTKKLVVVK